MTYTTPVRRLLTLGPLRGRRGSSLALAAPGALARVSRLLGRLPDGDPHVRALDGRVLGRVDLDVLPLVNLHLGRAAAVEVVVDVVEALRVRGPARARGLDGLLAEAAPEARLEVAPHAAVGQLLLEHRRLVDAVARSEVGLERLEAVAHPAALLLLRCDRAVGRHLLAASPDLELDVLAALVALPVILAAELLVAPDEGAGVGLFVSLLVFPGAAFVSNRGVEIGNGTSPT